MPHRLPSATRRTTLGVTVAGLVAVAGCELEDLDPRSDPAAPDGPSPSAPPQDADTTLTDGVVADLLATLGTAQAVRRRDRARFRPLVRLHRRHLAALGRTDPATDPATVPATVPVAAAEALRQEERLQRRLVTAAVAAESGELARLLASMSAAVAQQLAVLPARGGAS